MSHNAPKQPLTIRLAEPIVFLRGSLDGSHGHRRQEHVDAPPAMIRGLLTLHLIKPTRVSSIELTLEGKSTVQWSEGTGPRRVEYPEENKFLKAHTVFFSAKTAGAFTRSASVGPAIRRAGDDDDDDDESTHVLPPGTVRSSRFRFSLGDPSIPPGPNLSVPPPDRRNSADPYGWRRGSASTTATLQAGRPSTPPASPPYSPGPYLATLAEAIPSPTMPSELRLKHSPQDASRRNSRIEEDPGQMLEDFRNALRMETGSSIHLAPSRRPSGPSLQFAEPLFLPTDDSTWSPRSTSHIFPQSDSAPTSRPSSRNAERHETLPSATLPPYLTASPSPTSSSLRLHRASLSLHEHEHDHSPRGRQASLWTLSNVTSVFKDVKDSVRNRSPMEAERCRGRTPEPRAGTSNTDFAAAPEEQEHELRRREKERKSTLGKLTAAVRLDDAPTPESWKEFRKGTYTYPISFAIPSNTPPTIHCDYGAVVYRLKAVVHRPGALTTKLAVSTEVILVSCPQDDGTEDTHPIVVERQWDSQLQYLITLGGRSFPIGAQVPFSLTMVPLEKCKIYRLSVFLEEKTKCYIGTNNTSCEQAPKRFELLSIRNTVNVLSPILPLGPEDSSILMPYLTASTSSSSPDEALSLLMGPGPWALSHELQIPTQCGRISFTYKHKGTNISISHLLKVVFRVERGDDTFMDPKTGKRRLFDIIVQTPIHILSCHCNREQIALPRYSLFARVGVDYTPVNTCACSGWNVPGTITRASPGPTAPNSRPSTADASMRSGATADASLAENSYQFARLVSGQEGVRGEVPPEYTAIPTHNN